jgi:hypothetical protein
MVRVRGAKDSRVRVKDLILRHARVDGHPEILILKTKWIPACAGITNN